MFYRFFFAILFSYVFINKAYTSCQIYHWKLYDISGTMGGSSSKTQTASPARSPPTSTRTPPVNVSYTPPSVSTSTRLHASPLVSPSSTPRLTSTPRVNVGVAPQTTVFTQPYVSQTTVSSKVTSKDSSPLPVIVGDQTVKHPVNDYLIPKSEERSTEQFFQICVPFRKPVDKFSLYVCAQYCSRGGCQAPVCRRFHVCCYWVKGNCRNASCPYDHTFSAPRNDAIVDTLRRRKDFDMNCVSEILNNNHRFNKRTKREEHPPICMHSIFNKCNKKDSCSFVHANKSFVWEVKGNDGKWVKFSFEQSIALEKEFCQPGEEVVALPPLSNTRAPQIQRLKKLLNEGSDWEVDFCNMILTSDSAIFDIRRLSTSSDICDLKNLNRLATRWIWYWQDDGGVWNPYTDGCSSKFFICGLSDWLEYQYNFGNVDEFEVTLGNHSYSINVGSMTQLNKETRKQRNIRRRPVLGERRDKDIYFSQFFSTPHEEQIRCKIRSSSCEFAFVKNLMELSMGRISLQSVERVLNDREWKKYQNRKEQLKLYYKDNPSAINEQYLFHGTSHSVVDLICKENFDWRLYGDNVGHLYGRGVYFSNLASLSSGYGDSDPSGIRVMFIVLVLVGTMAIGNKGTNYPPVNKQTGMRFNTTCNDRNDSRVFVKYERNEHYPAYVAYYRQWRIFLSLSRAVFKSRFYEITSFTHLCTVLHVFRGTKVFHVHFSILLKRF